MRVKIIFLICFTCMFLPGPVMAQAQDTQPGLLDSLGSAISQLFSLNNPVRLDNPPSQFTLDQSPAFILITPQETALEEVTATITRKTGNKTLTALIKMIEPGKFEISLENPVKVTGEYSLDVSAKESFFYTRQIIHDFSWGSDKPKEKHRSGGFMKQFIEDHPEYKDKPVFKRDRNSVHFQKSDGTFEAQISSGPINYQDEKGEWKPIDPTLTQVGDELVGQGTPAKIKLDGTVEAPGSGHTQKTTKFGWFDSATQEFTPAQDLPTGQIKEDQFIRQGDFFEHVLTLLDTGLKEELTLNDLPPNLPDNPNSYLMLETEVTGLNLPDGWIDQDIKKEGFTFPLPNTKDAAEKEVLTKRFAKKVNSIQYIYTGILVSDLKTAAFPVIIDPDFATNANDAQIQSYRASGPYSLARSTSTAYNSTVSASDIGQYNNGTLYIITRFFLLFDTSSIGATSTVNQVNLKMTTENLAARTAEWDVQIIEQDWSLQNPISDANRETAYDACLDASTSILFRNTTGMASSTQYTSSNLTTGYVSKTGTTYYSMRSSLDYAGTAPTGNEGIRLRFFEDTTAAYRPVLTIDYTPANIGLQVSGMRMSGIQIK